VTRAKWLIIGAVVVCVVLFFLVRSMRSSSGLSAEQFVDVYVELSVASETFSADSVQLQVERNRIYEKAGVTPEEIGRFVSRLNRDPSEWTDVWKKIVERLEQRRQELK
jgi:hypothetical protein